MRALYCFQCGRDLSDTSFVQGARGAGKLVADAMRFMQEKGASMKELHAKPSPDGIDGQPLTCLNCGTLNRPDASQCVSCETPLIVADEDFNLIARGSRG